MENITPEEKANYDYLFKIVLVGDSGTGKSCLAKRLITGQFSTLYESTVGVDFHVKIVEIEDKLVKLQIWDTAGQERFRTIVPNYYRSSHGVILVYDCSDKKSYEHLADWLREVDRYASEDVDRVIVGNKCDIPNMKYVGDKFGKAVADTLGIPFYETSAKTGLNVEKVFLELAMTIKRRMDASAPTSEKLVRFNSSQRNEKLKCC